MKNCIYGIVMIFTSLLGAQVGIGTTEVDESAILEIESNGNKGLLVPRVSLTNTTTNLGVSPLESLLVYNLNDAPASLEKGFYFWSDSNQWERLLKDISNLSVTSNTAWNKIGTTSRSIDYEDDIYLTGELNINPNTNRNDEVLYAISNQGDSNNVTFGHFSNTASEGFTFNFGTGAGTTYDNASSVDNDVINQSVDWDVGSIRFSRGLNSIFSFSNKIPFAEIKVKTWGNGDVRIDRVPSQMWFEVNEAGDDNPDRVLRIDLHGRFRFVNSESVDNWSTSNLTTDKIVTIEQARFKTISKTDPNLRARSLGTNQNAEKEVLLKSYTLKKPQLVLGDVAVNTNVSFQVGSSKNNTKPMQIIGCPVYADNDLAKENGLSEGMIYKTKKGELKVVY